jgi:hypothetical protein
MPVWAHRFAQTLVPVAASSHNGLAPWRDERDFVKFFRLALTMLLALPCIAQQPAAPARGVLPEAETQKLVPPAVFFQGQTATTQLRNGAAVRLDNGGLVIAVLVDTGGYSSAVRERYQFYLLTDTSVQIGDKRLGPGAYGCGFLQDGVMVVMDLGGNDIFRTPIVKDADLTRPRPLQMVAGKSAGEFRLYVGRDYVSIRQSK